MVTEKILRASHQFSSEEVDALAQLMTHVRDGGCDAHILQAPGMSSALQKFGTMRDSVLARKYKVVRP